MSKSVEGLPPLSLVVVGGGVAGVSCAEEAARLSSACGRKVNVTVVSASRSLTGVRELVQITSSLESLQVECLPLDFLQRKYPGVRALQAAVSTLDVPRRQVVLETGQILPFDRIVLCTGARPHVPAALRDRGGRVAAIRDEASVRRLSRRLQAFSPKHIAIVGNGALSLELVHFLRRVCPVSWICRNSVVGSTLLDATASAFLLRQATVGSTHSFLKRDPSIVPASADARGDPGEQLGMPPKLPQDGAPAVSEEVQQQYSGNSLGPGWQSLLLSCISKKDTGAPESSLDAPTASTPAALHPVALLRGVGVVGVKEKTASASASAGAGGQEEEEKAGIGAESGFDSGSGADKFALCLSLEEIGAYGSPSSDAPRFVECDMVVVATGVFPRTELCADFSGDCGVEHYHTLYSHSTDEAGAGGESRARPKTTTGACAIKLDQGYGAGWEWGPAEGPDPVLDSGGAEAGTEPKHIFERGPCGGLVVDEGMRTTGSPLVMAAGDCAAVQWPAMRHARLVAECEAAGPCLWKQMRLWSQARIQGAYAGACAVGCLDQLELEAGYNFELFAHRTKLLGQTVVAMGLHQGDGSLEAATGESVIASGRGLEAVSPGGVAAGAGLGDQGEGIADKGPVVELPGAGEADAGAASGSGASRAGEGASAVDSESAYRVEFRVTEGRAGLGSGDCVKLVRRGKKLVGALLVGEGAVEELAEPLEQLMLSDYDASERGVDLLDSDFGVEHVFD